MLQPKKGLESRVNLALPTGLYEEIKFRADAAGVTVPEAIRQYLEIAITGTSNGISRSEEN